MGSEMVGFGSYSKGQGGCLGFAFWDPLEGGGDLAVSVGCNSEKAKLGPIPEVVITTSCVMEMRTRPTIFGG